MLPPDLTPPKVSAVATGKVYPSGNSSAVINPLSFVKSLVFVGTSAVFALPSNAVVKPEIFDWAIAALAEISALVIVPSVIIADEIVPVVILPDAFVITALLAAELPCAVETLALAVCCAVAAALAAASAASCASSAAVCAAAAADWAFVAVVRTVPNAVFVA